MKRYIPFIAAMIIIMGFAALGIKSFTSQKEKIKLREVQLKSTIVELEKLELDYNLLDHQIQEEKSKADASEEKVKQLETEKRQLHEKTIELEKQVSAKLEAQRVAAARFSLGSNKVYAATSDKDSWLLASGIPQSEWWAVDYIVTRESGWNPCAYNPGKSNCNLTAQQVNDTQPGNVACGLGQSLPCGKWGANWTDPVNQLKNQYIYVKDRYGGYPQAVNFWKANGHY